MSVYVLQIRAKDGNGYTSLHTDHDGAQMRLHEIAEAWGLTEDLENDELEHGIAFLPIEEGAGTRGIVARTDIHCRVCDEAFPDRDFSFDPAGILWHCSKTGPDHRATDEDED
jgi:hypothetical protein